MQYNIHGYNSHIKIARNFSMEQFQIELYDNATVSITENASIRCINYCDNNSVIEIGYNVNI